MHDRKTNLKRKISRLRLEDISKIYLSKKDKLINITLMKTIMILCQMKNTLKSDKTHHLTPNN